MRPAYANQIDLDVPVIHVVQSFEDAARMVAMDGYRYVGADPMERYEWDWAEDLTLAFHGRVPTHGPWDAMNAGARQCFFVDLDGGLNQWKRSE